MPQGSLQAKPGVAAHSSNNSSASPRENSILTPRKTSSDILHKPPPSPPCSIRHLSSPICHLPSAICHLPSAIRHPPPAIRHLQPFLSLPLTETKLPAPADHWNGP